MMIHPLQTESLARSIIDDRHRVPSPVHVSRRVVRRRTGTALLGAAVVLQRAGRSLQGAEHRPIGRVDGVELRPCS